MLFYIDSYSIGGRQMRLFALTCIKRQTHFIYEPVYDKIQLGFCEHKISNSACVSAHSDQGNRLFPYYFHKVDGRICHILQILTRLSRCSGWSEPTLVRNANVYPFSCIGSYVIGVMCTKHSYGTWYPKHANISEIIQPIKAFPYIIFKNRLLWDNILRKIRNHFKFGSLFLITFVKTLCGQRECVYYDRFLLLFPQYFTKHRPQ